MFNSNDNSMIWLLILFMLAGNTNTKFGPPTDEEICKAFDASVASFLSENEKLIPDAKVNSPLWQVHELKKAADNIEDQSVRLKVLQIAMSIIENLKLANGYATCGNI